MRSAIIQYFAPFKGQNGEDLAQGIERACAFPPSSLPHRHSLSPLEVDQLQTLRRPADQMANVPKLEIVVDDTSGVKGAVEVYYRFAG
jgi:hypothetical protein